MKRYSLWYLWIIFLLFSCKSEDVATSPTNSSSTGIVKVKVIYVVDNTNIGGVYIATNPASESMITDNNGEVSFLGLQPGNYKIMANKYGYFSNWTDVLVVAGKTTNATILLADKYSNNQPPNEPTLVFPENNSLENNDVLLTWTCSDPNADILEYDLYFDESYNPTTLIASDFTGNLYNKAQLQYNHTYYWKVVAKDPLGLKSESKVFSFKVDSSAMKISDDKLLLYMGFNSDLQYLASKSFTMNDYLLSYTADRKNRANRALSFQGLSFLEFNEVSYFDLVSPFSIALWVRTEKDPFGYFFTLLGKWGATGSKMSSYAMQINTEGKLCVSLHDGSINYICSDKSVLQKYVWKHVCSTFDGSTLKLYVNGILVNTLSSVKLQISNYKLRLGMENSGAGGLTGALDDIYIYGRILTDDEIKKLAAANK